MTLPDFWHDWRRNHRGALIACGMHPTMARVIAEMEAKVRAEAERHVGRTVALAAVFNPGPIPGTGTLMIDSHLVPPERRATAKAGLGLPLGY